MEIKIRFNTEKEKINGSLPAWRVIENGKERLAENIHIETSSWTTMDQLQNGVTKWHITCQGKTQWNPQGTECTILKLLP